jgi:myo-inositol-1(or 4)-monophosphatase
VVLASRSEVKRGEWERFKGASFRVQAMGSVAYKLALVAAGKADATWTLVPKNEWDVAAGVALVRAAGGEVFLPTGMQRRFNAANPKLPGLIASGTPLAGPIRKLLGVPG